MNKRKTKAEPVKPPANGNGHAVPPTEPPPAAPDIGAEVELVRLNIRDLNSAGLGAYQRAVDVPYVQFLEENWDWNAARVLLVNQRPDETYWLVDGQHRALAIQRLYGNIEVWCYLIHVAGPEEEAAIYERASDGHSKLTPTVLFRGRLTRGEPVAVAIREIVEEEGYTLTLTGTAESDYQLTNPAVLQTIYNHKRGGPARLREVLRFAKRAWADQRRFSASQVFSGVAKFIERYSDSPAYDYDRVVEVFSTIPLAAVYKKADEVKLDLGGHRHLCFARAMQSLYNATIPGGRKAKLYRKGED